MTKQERKANALLAEAKAICKKRMEYRTPVPAPNIVKPVVRQAPVPVMEKPLPPVVFTAPDERYDTLTVVKKGKGDYRLVGTLNGQKVDILNHFKSVTKAEEWMARHLK